MISARSSQCLVIVWILSHCVADHQKARNLENHASGDRTDSGSSIPWSTLINYTTKEQGGGVKTANNTSSYSYGPTVYYSPASYGQKSEPSPHSYYTTTTTSTYSTPSTTTKSRVYSYDDSPFAPATSSYVVTRKTTRRPSRFGTRTYYQNSRHPYEESEPESSNHPYQGFEKYKPNQQSDDDYEFEDENYGQSTKTSTSVRDPFGLSRRRGHKDHEEQDKGDYESESEKVPYPPWAYAYHKKPYHYGYGYDYNKLGYPGQDSGYGSLAFMLGLLPLGLMMAALVPNVVSMPLAAAAAAAGAGATVAGRKRRGLSNLQYPVLESISKFGMTKLDDPTCLQRIFCRVAVEGQKDGANVVQKVFYRVMTILDDDWADKVGLKALFRAVKRGQCNAFPCGTANNDQKKKPS